MAFNSNSPKFPIVYQSDLKQIGKVGPGTYQPYKNDKFISHNSSQCVFNSNKQRQSPKQQTSCPSELGPGKYDTQPAYQKFLIQKRTNGCQSSFKSKIDRFAYKQVKDQTTKDQDKVNIYEFLLDKEESKKKCGKLFGITRDRTKIVKSIPSIPSAEQSYGYRLDQKTKKLVQNQSPNVLLGRMTLQKMDSNLFNTTSSVYNGPGSYFIKDQKHIKGPKWHRQPAIASSPLASPLKNKAQKQCLNSSNIRHKNEIIQQTNDNHCIKSNKKWQQKGNLLYSREERFHDGKVDQKRCLLFNALKRKFGEFMNQKENLEQLFENSKKKNQINHISSEVRNDVSIKQSHQIQCFLAKQSRFSDQKQYPSQLGASNLKKKIQKPLQLDVSYSQSCNVGFGSKSQRFRQNCQLINKKIGPGSYLGASPPPKQKKLRKGTKGSEQNKPIQMNDTSAISLKTRIVFEDQENSEF